MVAGGTLISKVAEAPVKQTQILSTSTVHLILSAGQRFMHGSKQAVVHISAQLICQKGAYRLLKTWQICCCKSQHEYRHGLTPINSCCAHDLHEQAFDGARAMADNAKHGASMQGWKMPHVSPSSPTPLYATSPTSSLPSSSTKSSTNSSP